MADKAHRLGKGWFRRRLVAWTAIGLLLCPAIPMPQALAADGVQPEIPESPAGSAPPTVPHATDPVLPEAAPLRPALQSLRCSLLEVDIGHPGRATDAGAEHDVKDVDGDRSEAPALCGPLAVIEAPRMANANATAPVSIRLESPETPLRRGQSLTFDVEAPDFPAHLQVDYFTADGFVVHLLPNPLETSGRVEPRAVRRLGERKSGGRFWTIGPPFGDEMIVALASPLPLFPTPRPEAEPASAYLADLKRALDAAGPSILADARLIATESVPEGK